MSTAWSLFSSSTEDVAKETPFDVQSHLKKELYLRKLLDKERREAREVISNLENEADSIKRQTKVVLNGLQAELSALKREKDEFGVFQVQSVHCLASSALALRRLLDSQEWVTKALSAHQPHSKQHVERVYIIFSDVKASLEELDTFVDRFPSLRPHIVATPTRGETATSSPVLKSSPHDNLDDSPFLLRDSLLDSIVNAYLPSAERRDDRADLSMLSEDEVIAHMGHKLQELQTLMTDELLQTPARPNRQSAVLRDGGDHESLVIKYKGTVRALHAAQEQVRALQSQIQTQAQSQTKSTVTGDCESANKENAHAATSAASALQLRELQHQIAQYEVAGRQQTKDVAHFEELSRTLREERDRLAEQLLHKSDEAKRFHRTTETLRDEVAALEKQRAELKTKTRKRAEEHIARAQQLAADLASSSDQVRELEAEATMFRDKEQATARELAALKGSNADLQAKLTSLQRDLSQQSGEISALAAAQVALAQQKDELELRARSVEEELSGARAATDAQQRAWQTQRDQLTERSVSAETMQQQLERQVAALSTKLVAAQEDKLAAEEHHRQKLHDFHGLLELQTDRAVSLQHQLLDAQQEVGRLHESSGALQLQLGQLSLVRQTLQEELARADERGVVAATQMETMETRVQELTARLVETEVAHKSVVEMFTTRVSEGDEHALIASALRLKLEEQALELVETRAQCDALAARLEDSERVRAGQGLEVEALSIDLSGTRNALSQDRTRLAALEATVSTLENKLQASAAGHDEAEKLSQKLRDVVKQKNLAGKKLQKQIEKLQADMAVLQDSLTAAQTARTTTAQRQSELSVAVEEKDAELVGLKAQLAAIAAESEQQCVAIASLRADKHALEAALSDTQVSLEHNMSLMQSHSAEAEHLRRELDSVRVAREEQRAEEQQIVAAANLRLAETENLLAKEQARGCEVRSELEVLRGVVADWEFKHAQREADTATQLECHNEETRRLGDALQAETASAELLTSQLGQLREDVYRLEKQGEALRIDLAHQVEESHTTISKLKEELLAMTASHIDAAVENATLTGLMEQQQRKAAAEFADLQAQLDSRCEESDAARRDMEIAWSAKYTALSAAHDLTIAEMADAHHCALLAARQEVAELTEEQRVLNDRLVEVSQQLQLSEDQRHRAEQTEESQLIALRSEVQSISECLLDAQAQLRLADVRIQDMDRESEDARAQLLQATQRLEELQTEHVERATAAADMQVLYEEEAASLRDALEQQRRHSMDLETETANLRPQLELLRDEARAHCEALEALQASKDCATEQTAALSAEVRRLQIELASIREGCEGFESECAELRAEKVRMEDKIAKQAKAIRELKAIKAKLDKEAKTTTDERDAAILRLQELQDVAHTDDESMQLRLEGVTKERDEALTRVAYLTFSAEQLAQTQHENADLVETRAKLEAAVVELKQALDDAAAQTADRSRALAAQQEFVESLRQAAAQSESRAEALAQANESLQSRLEAAHECLSASDEALSQVQQAGHQLRVEFEEKLHVLEDQLDGASTAAVVDGPTAAPAPAPEAEVQRVAYRERALVPRFAIASETALRAKEVIVERLLSEKLEVQQQYVDISQQLSKAKTKYKAHLARLQDRVKALELQARGDDKEDEGVQVNTINLHELEAVISSLRKDRRLLQEQADTLHHKLLAALPVQLRQRLFPSEQREEGEEKEKETEIAAPLGLAVNLEDVMVLFIQYAEELHGEVQMLQSQLSDQSSEEGKDRAMHSLPATPAPPATGILATCVTPVSATDGQGLGMAIEQSFLGDMSASIIQFHSDPDDLLAKVQALEAQHSALEEEARSARDHEQIAVKQAQRLERELDAHKKTLKLTRHRFKSHSAKLHDQIQYLERLQQDQLDRYNRLLDEHNEAQKLRGHQELRAKAKEEELALLQQEKEHLVLLNKTLTEHYNTMVCARSDPSTLGGGSSGDGQAGNASIQTAIDQLQAQSTLYQDSLDRYESLHRDRAKKSIHRIRALQDELREREHEVMKLHHYVADLEREVSSYRERSEASSLSAIDAYETQSIISDISFRSADGSMGMGMGMGLGEAVGQRVDWPRDATHTIAALQRRYHELREASKLRARESIRTIKDLRATVLREGQKVARLSAAVQSHQAQLIQVSHELEAYKVKHLDNERYIRMLRDQLEDQREDETLAQRVVLALRYPARPGVSGDGSVDNGLAGEGLRDGGAYEEEEVDASGLVEEMRRIHESLHQQLQTIANETANLTVHHSLDSSVGSVDLLKELASEQVLVMGSDPTDVAREPPLGGDIGDGGGPSAPTSVPVKQRVARLEQQIQVLTTPVRVSRLSDPPSLRGSGGARHAAPSTSATPAKSPARRLDGAIRQLQYMEQKEALLQRELSTAKSHIVHLMSTMETFQARCDPAIVETPPGPEGLSGHVAGATDQEHPLLASLVQNLYGNSLLFGEDEEVSEDGKITAEEAQSFTSQL